MSINPEDIKNLPPEVLQFIKETTHDIEFIKKIKPTPKVKKPVISPKRMIEIENLAIGVLNHYYTEKLKEEVNKLNL